MAVIHYRSKLVRLLLLLPVALLLAGTRPGKTAVDPASFPRVNVQASAGSVNWANAAIFWFGRATDDDNYTDVRLGYNSQGLYVFATVVDYYLWYDSNAATDPRQYDALTLYLDTGGSNAPMPQPTSYVLVSGFRNLFITDDPRWHRQARGNGSNWDYNWSPPTPWTDDIGLRYGDSGPNNNSDLDAGWATIFTIPWATLGLSGPPASGQTWKMGTKLYDRDTPGAGATTTAWPNGFQDAAPETWGRLVFSPPPYQGSNLPVAGTTVITQGLNGVVVPDAYAGGGSDCSGGVFGGGDQPHPNTDLFVQNQSDMSDFPCFSKSYLKFDLSTLPSGKTIVSAILTLHEFGGSDPGSAKPSLVQLFTVADGWSEATLTWNNAPMAHENISSTTVPVLQAPPEWPGVPNNWNATQAVAEAHAAGKAVNLALYSADTAYHSGKYFVSSETGDWNAIARPTLTITWADPSINLTNKVYVPSVSK